MRRAERETGGASEEESLSEQESFEILARRLLEVAFEWLGCAVVETPPAESIDY